MWLVRLLPGMGPPTESPKTGTGKNKIKIKPSATLPPANVNAKTIVAVHRDAITAFHRVSGGRVDVIHVLFCSIAEHNGRPPMPPQIMAAMLDLTPEDMKDGPCIASEVQLTAAFERMVKPQDNGDNFKEKVMAVVEQQTKRCMHAEAEMLKIEPVLAKLHEACGGSTKALFNFFMDLLPEEQASQYSLEMWIAMVLKCPPTTNKVPLDHFVACFRDSMDSSDTADSIVPVAERHVGYLKDPSTAPPPRKPRAGPPPAAAAPAAGPPGAAGRPGGGGPPPPTPLAVEIVAGFAGDIKELHEAIAGRILPIHGIFNAVADKNEKPPIPPPVMAALLGLSREEMQSPVPRATLDQLTLAFQRMVKADDSTDNFRAKVMDTVREHTRKHVHAARQMALIQPTLTELHAACGGSCQALFDFFMDLLPEEIRPQLTLESFNRMVLKIHPKSDVIGQEAFMQSFQDSLDLTDTADKIQEVLERHVARLRTAKAAAPAPAADPA